MEIHGQLHNLRKTTLGDVLITISVDRSQAGTAAELMFHDVGTQFKISLEVEGQEEDLNEPTTRKFQKKMHELIREVAEHLGESEDEIKNRLRVHLISKEIIEKSTTELDIKGYTIANKILKEWKS